MFLMLFLGGCEDKAVLDTGASNTTITPSDSDPNDTDDSATDTSGPPEIEYIEGSLSGTIDIQLYTRGDDGERENISWDAAYAGVFPFGKIFVGAYYEDEEGNYQYVGYDIVENPQPAGNPYSIDIELNQKEDIRVFGVLDYYVDNITGTDEPIGGYNRAIAFEDGTQESNVNFSILSPLHEERPPCTNDDTIEITGDATITETYTGGEIAVILMEPGNVGPVHHSIVQPEILGGGAEAEYLIEPCSSSGYMVLKGIWDDNLNGMFDPMDKAGPYVSEPNQSGNPINVSYTNLSGHEIQIPLGENSGLKLVPFVNLLGTVRTASGLFDDLSTNGTLHVAALKYRPNGETSVSDIEEDSYDVQVFTAEDLAGKSEIEWKLTVPSETIAYLWAYLDVESNGMVNEPQEPIASGGQDDNGKFPTGSSSTTNIEMILAVMP